MIGIAKINIWLKTLMFMHFILTKFSSALLNSLQNLLLFVVYDEVLENALEEKSFGE